MVYLVREEEGRELYWQLETLGKCIVVTHGQTGAPGAVEVKTLNTPKEAKKVAERMAAQRGKSGYKKAVFPGEVPGPQEEMGAFLLRQLKGDVAARQAKGEGCVPDAVLEPLLDELAAVFPPLLKRSLQAYDAARLRAFRDRKSNRDKPAPDWAGRGEVLFRVEVQVWGNQLAFKARAYDWGYSGMRHDNEWATGNAELSRAYTVQDMPKPHKYRLLDGLQEVLYNCIQDAGALFFAPVVGLGLGFEDGCVPWWRGAFATAMPFEGAAAWLQALHATRLAMLQGEKGYTVNLAEVCWAIQRYVYRGNWSQMQGFLDAYYKNVEKNVIYNWQEYQRTLRWMLQDFCEEAVAAGPLDADGQALLTFTGELLVEYAENQEAVQRGVRYKTLAKTARALFPAQPATPEARESVQETGEDVFRTLRTGDVELCAGYHKNRREAFFDEGQASPGWVRCHILREREEAYKTAVGFLTEVVRSGFPVRTDFAFTGGVQNPEAVCGGAVLQGACCAFWSACAAYPALREGMRQYVKLAAQKVKRLSGDEMEEDDSETRRPDFYAAAVLALADPTGEDVAGSLQTYAGTIDMEYARALPLVVRAYLGKYGVTVQNAGALAGALHQYEEQLESYVARLGQGAQTAVALLAKCGKEAGTDVRLYEEMLRAL